MAVVYYNLTGNLTDILGVARTDIPHVRAWVESNLPAGQAIVDTLGKKIQLGSKIIALNPDGTFTISLLSTANTADVQPDNRQWRVVAEYPNGKPGQRGEREQWTSGWFTHTGAGDLANKVAAAPLTPTFSGDAAVAALVNDTGSSTHAALSAGYLDQASNLSDLPSAATARTNLGLAAVAASGSATDITTGTLPNSVLPPLAISETFTVASQAAMLALTAQQGDVAIRTDLNKSFILATNSPSTLADWKELLTPTDAVTSVAGKVGVVTLAAADITSGVFPITRLATGTPDGTKFVRDDGTLAVPAGGSSAAPLAYTARTAATAANYSTNSTTPVDVDATNLAVTFTAPASGTVMVRLSAASMVASALQHWSLRSGTTDVAGTERLITTSTSANRNTASMRIPGLTPGNSYTYKWAHRMSATAFGYIHYGGTEFSGTYYGPATMEVYAA